MRNLESIALRVLDETLFVLDQKSLPKEENWIRCEGPEHMAKLIQELSVRGAPLIGVAAALALAQYAQVNPTEAEFLRAAAILREARPTAVNLMNALDRLLANRGKLLEVAEEIFREDVQLCDAMACHGKALIADGDGVLTHCNAGQLATVGLGTAIGVILKAHINGKKLHVFVDETRPLLQGARLTAWELSKAGVPHTILCDNMSAILMQQGRVQKIFVGADRIALNGDFANKVGTYGLAVLAKHHNIPFYVVAPYTTIDFQCENGARIPIEERHADEVRGARGSFGNVTWTPENAKVFNPSFDVTPVGLVSGFVFESGVLTSASVRASGLKNLRKPFRLNS